MKKGFTLIELLAVVAILAAIAIIAGMSYTKISKEHQKNACEAFKEKIHVAAIEYYQDKRNTLHSGGSECIYLHGLISAGVVDYSQKEIEKITNNTYANAKQYKVCVKKNNEDFTVTSTANNPCK